MGMLNFSVPGPWEILIILLFFIVTVFPWWKICCKAGYPGPLSLLMLVPIANVILLFYFALAKWPIESKLERIEGPKAL
ncbi:MAG TPA: hypothetical protein VMY69_09010 [Phycisphaerae bacterium]|nr:hypothetical protein [Phycisphaerae bacterium]